MTDAQFNQVIECVANGQSTAEGLRKISSSFGSFYDLLDKQDYAEKYARAKNCSAEAHASRFKSLIDKVENGEIDPNAARVALDGLKWIACKLNPKAYGDKQTIEHSGKVTLLDEIRNGNAGS